ncbi:hypothetical protein R3P38DRAFT_3179753 [Favolaschia claudopus]|uniref:Uncharacterized protein n=1 Tax=Favolaschia claudopus TaxID=2862362 RepID=A0AAW0CPT6_9AGAR
MFTNSTDSQQLRRFASPAHPSLFISLCNHSILIADSSNTSRGSHRVGDGFILVHPIAPRPGRERSKTAVPNPSPSTPKGKSKASQSGKTEPAGAFLLAFVSLFHRVLECGHFKWLDPELWAAECRKARGPAIVSLDYPPSPSDAALAYLPSQYLPPSPSQLPALPPSQLYPPPPDVL